MLKVSLFLDDDTHHRLKVMAAERRLSLTKLIANICLMYLRDLDRKKTVAA